MLNIIYSNRDFHIDNKTMGWDVICFLGYVLFAFAAAFVVSAWIVKNKRLSEKIVALLGAGNEWYELFDGKYATLNFDMILLNVVTGSKESTLIYTGYLENYYFQTKSTELDYIVLTQATRRDLRKQSLTEQALGESERASFYSNEPGVAISLPGDVIVIPAKEILNINITYLQLEVDHEMIEELEG